MSREQHVSIVDTSNRVETLKRGRADSEIPAFRVSYDLGSGVRPALGAATGC
jgi:hypothetical protein